jgi:uncharacterized alkaline shock family protein YloU
MASTTPSTVSTTTVAGLNADTSQGTTKIADSVIAKVAGIAAREVPGVHDLGGNVARAIGAIRGALNNSDQSQGVSVEVGETQVAVDVTLIAEYPVSLQSVADGVRSAVIDAIESLVGLQVTEVNVTISDVNIPTADDDAATTDLPARVQ